MTLRGSRAAGLLLVGIAVVLGGCVGEGSSYLTPVPARTQAAGEVTVFAATSLQDAFREMAKGLEGRGLKVSYNFGGSQALVAQLGQGARAGVLATADRKSMDAAAAAGSVVTGTQRVFAGNHLVVVVSESAAGKISSPGELAGPGVRVALADSTVPAGRYSLEVLDKLSVRAQYGPTFRERVLANVVTRENNVRQVLAKVQLGEADAGIVYSTDAPAGAKGVRRMEIPPGYNVTAGYYIAPVSGEAGNREAEAFIEYVLSAEGQAALAKYGFDPPVEVGAK